MSLIEILLISTIILQLFAALVALSLVNHTKYMALWIFCVITLGLLIAERLFQLSVLDGEFVSPRTRAWVGIAVSFCLSMCIFCARLLVSHVDRITMQRRMLENKLMTAVLRTEERSRAEISRDLHDGLGPLLSSAKMSLSAVSKEGMTEKDKDTLRNTAQVIDEAIRSLREISNNLSPHMLNNFGLARGIKNFVDRVASLHDVQIEFRTKLRSERFDSNIEVIIYRVACELINNSLKHSKCRRIDLELVVQGANIVLKYSDDGCGFSFDDVKDRGMGISNMNSRISSLSGTFRMDSTPGSGMTAYVEVSTDSAMMRDTTDVVKRRKILRYGKQKGEHSSRR
jgi:signal transduction histidine kinase